MLILNLFVFLLMLLILCTCLEVANLASFLPQTLHQPKVPNLLAVSGFEQSKLPIDNQPTVNSSTQQPPAGSGITSVISAGSATTPTQPAAPTATSATATPTTTPSTTTTIITTTTASDGSLDLDDSLPPIASPPPLTPNQNGQSTASSPSPGAPDATGGGGGGSGAGGGVRPTIAGKNPASPSVAGAARNQSSSLDMKIVFYSIFIVYVSFIKLIYHNVAFIKRNLTEPGVLMIFGIIWELIARQLSTNYEPLPKFNSHIFFYLFLPATVLESASLLSNKWLFLNLISIFMHAILGTLFYASALGFTIFSLSRNNVFNLSAPNGAIQQQQAEAQLQKGAILSARLRLVQNQLPLLAPGSNESNLKPFSRHQYPQQQHQQHQLQAHPQGLGDRSTSEQYVEFRNDFQTGSSPSWSEAELLSYQQIGGFSSTVDLNNLTLADCLLFGTILSSIDSATMLGVLRLHQVNDKLYYLILGESLMNNAVVLVIFDLLLEFLNETRLTVVKIYFAIIQFFLDLFGSVFIGLVLAAVALVSVRLTKQFQVPNALTSYQSQCQAMVETLLILKLAYLTYTLAALAGTSSIVSLTTFGIIQDQYIKHNLNLRSQLTFKQVILATKTMGISLVYPLLGMLLVDVANSSQLFSTWSPLAAASATSPSGVGAISSATGAGGVADGRSTDGRQANALKAAASVAASKLSQFANQANLYWNFKFLSLLTVVTVVYRFVSVIGLSLVRNLFSSGQLKINFREQILVAYAGSKGPLAFALVHKLIQYEEFHEGSMRNKYLFMYTILFITFLSTLLKGAFIRPLVSKMQQALVQNNHSAAEPSRSRSRSRSRSQLIEGSQSIVFDEINCKLVEHVSTGLNSIIGHTKSPYDKFVELNETHIKPWLARAGSNTNWLNVFYDNLALDETLNANCFHRAGEHPALQSYLKSADNQHLRNQSGGLAHRQISRGGSRKQPQTQLLEIIDEHSQLVHRGHQQNDGLPLPSSSSQQIHNRRAANGGEDPTDKGLLKEFVMFNLKLEDSRRRNKTQLGKLDNRIKPLLTSDEASKDYLESGATQTKQQPQHQRARRMLSTTSTLDTSDSDGKVISMDLAQSQPRIASRIAKDLHLAELERQSNAICSPDQQQVASTSHRRQVINRADGSNKAIVARRLANNAPRRRRHQAANANVNSARTRIIGRKPATGGGPNAKPAY